MPENDVFREYIQSMNRDVIVRPAVTDDAKAFINLMNRHFRRQKTDAYFFWQFIDNPCPARLYLAWHQNTLAGCFGVMIRQLNRGVPCGFTVDLVVDYPFRNQGLPFLLEESAADFANRYKAVALIALPNETGCKALVRMPDWKCLGAVPTLELDKPPSSVCPCKVNSALSQAEQIKFMSDETYREWRFNHNPFYRYERIVLDSSTYSVTKLFTDPAARRKIGDIVDFSCDSENSLRLQELFRMSVQRLQGYEIKQITTWALPHTVIYQNVLALGFRASFQTRYFCAKILNSSFAELDQFDRWHLVQADSEVY